VTGGGRAGKTSLCRSLQNLDFKQTDSTVGIDSTTLEMSVDHIAVREGKRKRERGGEDEDGAGAGGDGGVWVAHSRPEKEMEFLIAKTVVEKERKQTAAKKTSSSATSSSLSSSTSSFFTSVFRRPSTSVSVSGAAQAGGHAVPPPSGTALSISYSLSYC
jgi:hypothetical protein